MKFRIQIVAVLLALGAASAQASETARHALLGRMFTTNDYFGFPGEVADPFTCNGSVERSKYYNTATHIPYFCNGTSWVSMSSGSLSSPESGNIVATGKWTFGSAADAAGSVRLGETASCIVFEGATADAFETKVCVTDPTAALTFNTPNAAAGTYSFLTTAAAVTVAQGGTGISSGTSGGVPYFSASGTIASSGALGANQITLGGGAGAAPTSLSCGTSTTVLHGGTPPTCVAVAMASDTDLNFAAKTPYFTETDNGNSGTSKTINWLTGGAKQKITTTGSCTITFTAPTGPANILLKIVHEASATAYTYTWPVTVKWPSGSAIATTNTSGAVDIMSCYYDGTNYYCIPSTNFS